jgi:hypothetical protein
MILYFIHKLNLTLSLYQIFTIKCDTLQSNRMYGSMVHLKAPIQVVSSITIKQ